MNDTWSNLLTDEDRKKEVLKAASQHINNYLSEAEKNKGNIDFGDLETVNNAKKKQRRLKIGIPLKIFQRN